MKHFFMRYPEGKTKAVTFSYDDGVEQDRRLVSLFDKYNLKATFNFNCEKLRDFAFTKEEIDELFLSKGHEIAIHGANHRANGFLRPIEGIREVLECRLELEEKCGRIIRGMAYPNTGITQMANFADYSQIKAYLKELDIAYARTLLSDNDSFQLPSDFHAWVPTTYHAKAYAMEYAKKFVAIDGEVTRWTSRKVPLLFYMWGHSYELDRNVEYNSWEYMEELLSTLANKDDTWYATNIEIHDYVEAYGRLVYSADGRMIYNPTLYTIWIEADGVIHCVKSGETLRLEME